VRELRCGGALVVCLPAWQAVLIARGEGRGGYLKGVAKLGDGHVPPPVQVVANQLMEFFLSVFV
jgi:hypothetical protein